MKYIVTGIQCIYIYIYDIISTLYSVYYNVNYIKFNLYHNLLPVRLQYCVLNSSYSNNSHVPSIVLISLYLIQLN